MRSIWICVLTILCVLLIEQNYVSCNKTFNPNHQVLKKAFVNVEKTIQSRIKKFFRKIKIPTYKTSLSMKVCPRRPSPLILKQVNTLKKLLQSSAGGKKPGKCLKTIFWRFKKIPTHQGKTRPLVVRPEGKPTRHLNRCDISTMTAEEKKARDDLKPHGISKNRICVRKEGSCHEQGKVDPNTKTLNMCHSCRFTVYIPENYFPNSFIHFQCGNGEDISCLMSEGACKKRQLHHHIKGINNQHAALTITTGCACEILAESIFKVLVK